MVRLLPVVKITDYRWVCHRYTTCAPLSEQREASNQKNGILCTRLRYSTYIFLGYVLQLPKKTQHTNMKKSKHCSTKREPMGLTSSLVVLLAVLLCMHSCSTSYSKISSVEFVPVEYTVIAQDTTSVILQPNVSVCYNRFANEAMLPLAFQREYRTDTISYKGKMAIKYFLGNQNTYKNVRLAQVLENKSEIMIFFEADLNSDKSIFFQPFVIATMHKTRKNVRFYLNDEDLGARLQSLYVK